MYHRTRPAFCNLEGSRGLADLARSGDDVQETALLPEAPQDLFDD